MRFLLVAILGFALVATGIFFPWGEKDVQRADCRAAIQPDGGTHQMCDVSRVEARYWSDHITADLFFWKAVDGERTTSISAVREFHDYQMAGEELDGNAALFWGRPVLWAGIGVAGLGLVMLGATRRRDDGARWVAVGLWLSGAGLLALGAVLGVGGMVIHSGTWAGVYVSRLRPSVGTYLVAAGAIAGTYAAVRHGQQQVMRLRGIDDSPLAPILQLEAPEPERDARGKVVKPPLRWTRSATLAVLAILVLTSTLLFPFATKAVTRGDCTFDDDAQDWDCTFWEHKATYFASRADVRTEYNDTPDEQESLPYNGEFQNAYGGGDLMWWIPVAFILAPVVLVVQAIAQPRHLRWGRKATIIVTWSAWGTCLLAVLAAAGLIAQHAFGWPGTPPGRLLPHVGAFLAAAGLVIGLASAISATRPPKVRVVGTKRQRDASA